ncbi:MAG: 50S ribosomal protein L22 [Planctomycetes bacterium]|nr:50S ribosomal protein L22 [Planctomycetota bacterium]MCD7897671.1 50S ribosomal protein L22 [Planctomycetaceae bacterium]
MGYVAKHRHAPIKAYKARLVIDLVRGKSVNDALNILRYKPQRAARMIERVIKSAQANAEDRGAEGQFYIAKAWVDEGFMMKRFRPRSRGGAAPYLRRRSHICVEVDVLEN